MLARQRRQRKHYRQGKKRRIPLCVRARHQRPPNASVGRQHATRVVLGRKNGICHTRAVYVRLQRRNERRSVLRTRSDERRRLRFCRGGQRRMDKRRRARVAGHHRSADRDRHFAAYHQANAIPLSYRFELFELQQLVRYKRGCNPRKQFQWHGISYADNGKTQLSQNVE